jgi:hypothetical protein
MGQNLLFLSDFGSARRKGPETESSLDYWGVAGSVLIFSTLDGVDFYFFFLEKQPNIIKL